MSNNSFIAETITLAESIYQKSLAKKNVRQGIDESQDWYNGGYCDALVYIISILKMQANKYAEVDT